MFPITSRYASLPLAEHVTPDGRAIAYVRRRFVPQPERFETLFEHLVTEGERLDVITAQHLGDPEQFWRVCDANGAIQPADPGSRRPADPHHDAGRHPGGQSVLKGVYLTLLIGPAVPVPAPPSVLDALTSIQVTSSVDRSGFQLTFGAGRSSPLLTTLLPAGFLDPLITRVIIVVTVNGMPHVISDGMVTRQDVAPSSEPGSRRSPSPAKTWPR